MAALPVTCFAGEKVAVLGLGKSGLVAAAALRAGGALVEAWDDEEATRARAGAQFDFTDDLVGYAEQLSLDLDRFTTALREHAGAGRVAEDVDGAELSGVSGTPTFFINGRRHYGAYDIATLSAAVRAAGARAALAKAAAD